MKIKKIWLPSFINAMFTWITPNTIWVNKRRHQIEDDIEHEICHYEQCKRYGLLKYMWLKTGSNILQFFGVRSGIEMEAYARQDSKDFDMRIKP